MAIHVDMNGPYGYLQQMLEIRCNDLLARPDNRDYWARDVEYIRGVAKEHAPEGKERGNPCAACGEPWPCQKYIDVFNLTDSRTL